MNRMRRRQGIMRKSVRVRRVKARKAGSGDAPDLSVITKNAKELSMLSLEMEEKREQSLITQSSQMLTAFSFLSAAMLMLAPLLIDNLKGIVPPLYILACAGISFALMLASMVLALFVQWRYKYQALPGPMGLYEHLMSNAEYFKTPEQRNKSWIETIGPAWESKRRINDRRVVLITVSMIIFLCAVGSMALSVWYGYLFYIAK